MPDDVCSSSSPVRRHLVICGAGIMGCATAFYLAKIESQLRVTVVERHEVAGTASGRAGGFLAKGWCSGAVDVLATRSYELHEELAKQFPEIEYRRMNTTLEVSKSHGMSRSGAPPAWLDGEGLGASSMDDKGATAQVHPRKLSKAMLDFAVAKGRTKLVKGTVEGVTLAGKQVKGVLVDGEIIQADLVLVSMGPWASAACEWFPDANLPDIVGHRAHSIVLEAPKVPADALFLHMDKHNFEVYPRPDGTVYVCGANDDVPVPKDPADISPDPNSIKRILETAKQVSSCFMDSRVLTEQACYLPYSSNGAPLIGVIPGYQGAYLAAGHSCWGILTGPATGLALAEMMEYGKTRTVDVSKLSP